MKLRINRTSLRLRLNRSDVEQFRKAGICAEVLRFGSDSQLAYTLETSTHVKRLDAEYRQNCIRVLVPLDLAEHWVGSDQVSLSLQRADDSGPSLLIEKDFQCIHCGRDPSEDADSFPNPLVGGSANTRRRVRA